MNTLFAETLKKLRKEKGLSQVQLGKQMFVNNSTVARWENGTRLPDAAMIARLSRVLDVDVSTLFTMAAKSDESPNIIMVDDNKVLLTDGLSVLEEVMPNATITGFIWLRRPLNTRRQTPSPWPSWISSWDQPAAWTCAIRCRKSTLGPMSSI